MATAVISVIGHDRPGLVNDITAQATANDLNIEDSRMTVLGGEFAVLMALEGTQANLAAFDTGMQHLCGDQLAYLFRPTQSRAETLAQQGPTLPYRAVIVALDHPGIVHAIAGFFSERNINIRDLTTETQPAAHTGTPVFSVILIAEVPKALKVNELRQEFEVFCADQDLDGTLTAAT